MTSDALEVTLSARTDRYDADDDRWLDQVAELRRTLRQETGAVQAAPAAVAGMKGAVDQLILALGSAGAFTTTVEMLRVWLARDKTRSVHAEWTDENGTHCEATLSAENADSTTLAPLVEALSRKIGAVS
jgi:membrane-associated two-gene conflict system component 1 (EACC1)